MMSSCGDGSWMLIAHIVRHEVKIWNRNLQVIFTKEFTDQLQGVAAQSRMFPFTKCGQ